MYNIIVYTCVLCNMYMYCTCTCTSYWGSTVYELSYLSAFILITGVHAEGPFINRTKKGAHAEVHVQDTVSYSLIQECYGSLDNMRIITLAPELPGAMEVIPLLVNKGIVVALGTIVICILYGVICKGLL